MLSVYFVDDDLLIIEELKRIIEWNKYGFEIIGYTTNPLIAEKEIVEFEPTLVISDVQMDEMSGLALANKLCKVVNSKFVFLSAYDRFDYAVEAIKIGAVRYIKKPIKKNNLIELLDEIRNSKIEEFNNKIFNKMTESINSLDYQKKVKEIFENNPFFPKNATYRVVSIRKDKDETNALDLIKENSSFSHVLYNDDTLILVICFSLNYKKVIDEIKLNNVTIVFSKELIGYDEVSSFLKKVRICSLTKFFLKTNQIVEIIPNSYVDEICKKIDTCDNIYNFHQLITVLKDAGDKLLVSDVQRIYRCCVYALFRLNVIEYQEELIGISAIDYYENYYEMISDLLNYFQNTDSTNKDSNEYIIEQIKKDIKERINERIPLSYYSQKYGYYNSYLSKIFKSLEGVSFIEYVINLKMDVAKFKIENEPKKAFKEIALEVGYDDYYHFSKIFKKMCDCSPYEYRERCLKNDKNNLN